MTVLNLFEMAGEELEANNIGMSETEKQLDKVGRVTEQRQQQKWFSHNTSFPSVFSLGQAVHPRL